MASAVAPTSAGVSVTGTSLQAPRVGARRVQLGQARRPCHVSCSAASGESATQNQNLNQNQNQNQRAVLERGVRSLVAAASAAVVLASPALAADVELTTYYGTAASASSYGGDGGDASKKDTAEYVYDVPSTWKERAISKVEKGTNGTDSEFYNPRRKNEKAYVTFLAGFRRLPPKDNVLNDIALSDVNLQDLLAAAESTEFKEARVDGQLYYDFDIDSSLGHALISVTAAKNKLYAHFVEAPPVEWSKDEALLRQIHASFKTVGRDPLAPPDQF